MYEEYKLTFEQHCELVDKKLALEKRAKELYTKEGNGTITKEEFHESMVNMRERDAINAKIYASQQVHKVQANARRSRRF